MKHVLVTFPRSGRNVARWMLSTYHGPAYDTRYAACRDLSEPDLFFTHDFELEEDWAGRDAIVLVRDPLEAFASWFRMNVRDGGRVDTEEEFFRMVEDGLVTYWKGFVDKWLAPSTPETFVRTYRELIEGPEVFLRHLLGYQGVEADMGRVKAMLAMHPVRRKNHPMKDFPPYKDKGFVAAIEETLQPQLDLVRAHHYL